MDNKQPIYVDVLVEDTGYRTNQRYLPIDSNSRDLALFAVNIHGQNFIKFPKFYGDAEMALTALKNCNGFYRRQIFPCIDKKLTSDPEFFIEALKTESKDYLHDLTSITALDFFHTSDGSIFDDSIASSLLINVKFQEYLKALDEFYKKYIVEQMRKELNDENYAHTLSRFEKCNYETRLTELIATHIKQGKLKTKLAGGAQYFYLTEQDKSPTGSQPNNEE